MAAEITPNHFSIEEQNGLVNAIVTLIETDKNSEVLTCAIEAMINLVPHSRTIHENFVKKKFFFTEIKLIN